MNHEFQNTLFSTVSQMCDAIAYEWMTAGGKNSATGVTELLRVDTAEGHAQECIEAWGLDAPASNGYEETREKTWLQARNADTDDVTRAFERFATERPDTKIDS